MTQDTLIDTEDLFETQLKEQEYKKKKKLEKLERLNRKKVLIDEIKNVFDHSAGPASFNTAASAPAQLKKGSLEWSLFILNATPNSSLEELKKNYILLAQKYHPDKNQGQTSQEMKDLNEAWEKIKQGRLS